MTNDGHAEIKGEHDLMPPGGAPGTVPTDLEQATGLERLEILGKMQGVDIFDMRPLDASRLGTHIIHIHPHPYIYTLFIGHTHTDPTTLHNRHNEGPDRSQVLRRRAIRRLHRLPSGLPRCHLAHYLPRPTH